MKINHVATDKAVEWYMLGWDAFKRDKSSWVLVTILFLILIVGLGLVPLLNSLLYVFLPLLIAGSMYLARRASQGEVPALEHFFIVFNQGDKREQLLWMGVIMLGIMLLLNLILPVNQTPPVLNYSLTDIANASKGIETDRASWRDIAYPLLRFISGIGIGMLFVFAPALVLFKRLSATDALKASFQGCWSNKGAVILFIGLYMIFMLLALLPFGLGLLILVPVLMNALYMAYQEIFTNHSQP